MMSKEKNTCRNICSRYSRAKREGINVRGYFVWTFTDNFEWAEGYHPAFGLVHVDFKTQKRTIKASGHWYSRFLSEINVASTTTGQKNFSIINP